LFLLMLVAWVALRNGRLWTATCLALPALFFVLKAFSAPFDYFLGYVGEKQMGFSNLTAVQWWLLYAKRVSYG
jgi:hypothetical protein